MDLVEAAYYLEYQTAEEKRVFLRFQSENDRDGCHISLDMYKAQLGLVTMTVLLGIAQKFNGEIALPDDKKEF
jgi:hypothetical protein